jgi:hypothetical protein
VPVGPAKVTSPESGTLTSSTVSAAIVAGALPGFCSTTALGRVAVAHQPLPGISGLREEAGRPQFQQPGRVALARHRVKPLSMDRQRFLAGRNWKTLRRDRDYLRWQNWRLEHPHDTPPYPFRPSPTFVHSSTNSMLAGKLTTGRMMNYVGPDKECRQQVFDNTTGQMTKPTPCDLSPLDSNGDSVN